MDRTLLQIDDTTHRLRRVGRLARRRMRLEGAKLTNGTHTDGRLTVTISGLGDPSAGAPDTFDWTADRPIALVIVRAGVDGDDVSFNIGPARAGSGVGTALSDGTGIRYIAFCYDAEPDPVAVAISALPASALAPAPVAAAAPVATRIVTGRERISATVGRRSILGQMLRAGSAA